MEDRERTLDSPTDKIMSSLTAFADELEREKARQRTYDAMQRKARAGHVTGGRAFGYDNVEVRAAAGQRSHVERRINDAEAAIVRRIFTLCANGDGVTSIAKTLNAEAVPTPRAQRGRPAGWVSSSIREVLMRTLYRGEIVSNKTRKRNAWGVKDQQARPKADWIHIPAPELQIVVDDLWAAAHRAWTTRQTKYANGSRVHRESPYLRSGFARCAQCGGGFASHLRTHGKKRARFYACTAHWKGGTSVCKTNSSGAWNGSTRKYSRS
jgi:site-specific DNA recombinase